jgi:hypothetical protein
MTAITAKARIPSRAEKRRRPEESGWMGACDDADDDGDADGDADDDGDDRSVPSLLPAVVSASACPPEVNVLVMANSHHSTTFARAIQATAASGRDGYGW